MGRWQNHSARRASFAVAASPAVVGALATLAVVGAMATPAVGTVPHSGLPPAAPEQPAGGLEF